MPGTTLDAVTRETYEFIGAHHSPSEDQKYFWADSFNKFADYLPSGKVIDLGCGYGSAAPLFVEKGYRYIGIDYSANMLARAEQLEPKGLFCLSDMEQLAIDFLPKEFDGFWAAASLHHIPKARMARVLGDIRTITRPGGVGFISMREEVPGVRGEGLLDTANGPIFFSLYDKEQFAAELQNAGFEVVESYRSMMQYFSRSSPSLLNYVVRNSA